MIMITLVGIYVQKYLYFLFYVSLRVYKCHSVHKIKIFHNCLKKHRKVFLSLVATQHRKNIVLKTRKQYCLNNQNPILIILLYSNSITPK